MWWHKEKRDADAWEFIEIASTARLAYGKGRIIAMDLGATNFFFICRISHGIHAWNTLFTLYYHVILII
jgi:hypothetical protein